MHRRICQGVRWISAEKVPGRRCAVRELLYLFLSLAAFEIDHERRDVGGGDAGDAAGLAEAGGADVAELLPRLKAQADASGDLMEAQQVRDLSEQINRFERRLHDLQLSRTITVQTAPQIRIIQSNNRTLAEKIQTSILATIPIWKSQMVLALSLHGQKNAAALQKTVSDTTNDMLRSNAELLEQAAVDTAREVERSVVDIETLREVHEKLIGTIEETLRIAQEGRERRAAAEKELAIMETELKDRLTSLAARKSREEIAAASGTETRQSAPGQGGTGSGV